MNQVVEYMDRPPSEQLVDLHVYLVPTDLWRQQLNSAFNTVIEDTVSKGFIRVLPEMKMYDLRAEVEAQLGTDIIPSEYVFLKSVGRCLTQVKPKQELTLKVKHFLPPYAYQPEIFLLEATAEVKALTHESPRGLSSYSDEPRRINQPYPGGSSYPSGQYPNGHQSNNGQYPGSAPGYPGAQYPGQLGRYSQPNYPYDQNKNIEKSNRVNPPGRRTVVLRSQDSNDVRSTPQSTHSTQTGDDLTTKQTSRLPGQRHFSSPPHLVPSTPSQDEILALPGPDSPCEPTPSPTFDNPSQYSDPVSNKSHSQPGEQSLANNLDLADSGHSSSAIGDSGRRTATISSQNVQQTHPKTPTTHITARVPTREKTRHSLPPADDYLPPLSATPPVLPLDSHKRQPAHNSQQDPRLTHTSNTADDSGISEPTPDDPEFRQEPSDEILDRRKENNNKFGRHNNQDMTQRWVEDDNHLRGNDDRLDDQQNGENGDGLNNDRVQGQQLNGDSVSNDTVHGRQLAPTDDRYEDRRDYDEGRQILKDEDDSTGVEDFPSPPLLDLEDRETHSAKQSRISERDKLLEDIEIAREDRKEVERKREELVRRAKAMQNKTNNRRNQARDMWKKKYFEEKKRTTPLEDESSRLRHEVDALHRKLMSQLEVNKDSKANRRAAGNPSVKNNYKIQATKLQHDNDDLKRKVETAKMKLTAEMKLRNQAETELRALRAELSQKKINVNLTRSQQLAALTGQQADISPRTPRINPRS